ncbi:MAG: hypothetical protein H7Z12_11245 [Rhodospirillaceae bacterium]|nr:hypothetical protein [Rhodospirillales bacterium]
MRQFFTNLALTLASTLVFLMLCEAALWLVAPPPKPPFPKDMFTIMDGTWVVTPGFSGQMDNRVDFRGKQATADGKGRRVVPAAPADAPVHVKVLGDSQTFGHGLSDDESWPNRLQEALSARGINAKVENLGVPAINVDQYVVRLRNIAGELHPGDVVVVGISWNDLTTPQDVDQPAVQMVGGYMVSSASGSDESKQARVRLYDATGIALPPLQDLKSFLDGLSQTSALVHNLYPRAKAIYYRLRQNRPLDAITGAKVPEANMFLLSRMRDMAAAKGAKFVVALLPDRMFFEDDAYRIYSAGGRDYPEQNYMGYLARPLCERFALTCVDSFPLLHDNQHIPVAYRVDGHYTPEGARLIGPWLAGQLFP